jgi:hypothetical protein
VEDGVTRRDRDIIVIYVLSTHLAKASLAEQSYRRICSILNLEETDDFGDVEMGIIPTVRNICRWL